MPLLAGSPPLLAQSAASGRSPAAAVGSKPLDPFIDYSVRQLGVIQRRAHATGRMRGEDARAAAQHLRAAIAYAQSQDLDGAVKRALTATTDANGRDVVVYAEIDKARALRAMREFGFEISELPDTSDVDYPARAALLDELLKHGVTPGLNRVADALERVSSELDRRAALADKPLVQVQDSSWWAGFCSSLKQTISQLQAEASVLYVVAWFFPDLFGAYYLYQAAITVDSIIYGVSCWW